MKILTVGLWAVAVALAGPAGALVVNNGFAPPLQNVFDAPSFTETLVVRNVDCNGEPPLPQFTSPPPACPSPGAPTAARVDGAGPVVVSTSETSSASIASGEVGFVFSYGSSSIVIEGGAVVGLPSSGVSGVVLARDASSVLVTGGVIGSLAAGGVASATITGGSFNTLLHPSDEGFLSAAGQGQLFVVGSGFAIDGVPVGLGPVAAATGLLSGTFASGESFAAQFEREDQGELILVVPEPASAALSGPFLLALSVSLAVRRDC